MANKVPLVAADFESQLSTAIAVGGTSFSLSSATDDDGNSLPAGKYCFTVDNGKSNKEYLLGQLNGTAVTSVVRVSRQGVEASGSAYAHRVGASVIISDFATIQRVADILRGQIDLDGANPVGYDAEPTLADRKDLATVGYVLDTVTGGTVSFDTQTVTGNGGEAIVAGDLVYFKTSDQEWYKTDADTASTVEGVLLGIALGTGSDGVAITGGVLVQGLYTTTGLTAGSEYYASNTAGAYATSAGTTSRKVGIALSTTKLYVYSSHPQTVTTNEKAALAGGGEYGTPSSTNKFITDVTRKVPLTAGETITGATTPVPVYQNKTDNEFYICDANDTGKLKFIGFAVSNGTDGTAVSVQFNGVVSGFTGLAEGEKYYLSDTAGAISTTIGTYEVLVGVAISETQLLIQKGRRYANGHTGSLGEASGSSAVTCGFRPSRIVLYARGKFNASPSYITTLDAVWVNGVIKGVATVGSDTTSSRADNAARLYSTNPSYYMTLSIGSVTDTGFTISWSETGNFTADATECLWEAEGEL